MPNLCNIRESITSMSIKDSLKEILDIRFNRRRVKEIKRRLRLERPKKPAKLKATDREINDLKDEAKLALIQRLEGKLNVG